MFDGRDTIVMFDKLAYEDLLPVRWRAQTEPVSDLQAQQYSERNLRVLQACDALEEQGRLEKPDEDSPQSADIMRLDMKLNLLLDLAAQLLAARDPGAQRVQIRLNAMGAHFVWTPAPAVGFSAGLPSPEYPRSSASARRPVSSRPGASSRCPARAAAGR